MNGTKGPQRRGPRLGRPGRGDPHRVSRRTPGNGPGPRGGGEALVAARVLVDETPAVAAEWRGGWPGGPGPGPPTQPPPPPPGPAPPGPGPPPAPPPGRGAPQGD